MHRKYWEIIADNLSKASWSWDCVSAIDSNGRTIWIADAHRGDGKRFVVRADDMLTTFSGTRISNPTLRRIGLTGWRDFFKTRRVKRICIRRRTFSPLGSSPLGVNRRSRSVKQIILLIIAALVVAGCCSTENEIPHLSTSDLQLRRYEL